MGLSTVERPWDGGLSGFDVPGVDVAHRSVVGTGEGVLVVRALRRAWYRWLCWWFVVGGEGNAEKVSHEMNADTHWVVKAT